MLALSARLFQFEEKAYRDFRPRATDVIISPLAECGTTWLQQIVHSLRTAGDMDFRDIYEVVPFIDVAPVLGQDLTDDQPAHPRAFKSHCDWHAVPKGCRYLVSFRDPLALLATRWCPSTDARQSHENAVSHRSCGRMDLQATAAKFWTSGVWWRTKEEGLGGRGTRHRG